MKRREILLYVLPEYVVGGLSGLGFRVNCEARRELMWSQAGDGIVDGWSGQNDQGGILFGKTPKHFVQQLSFARNQATLSYPFYHSTISHTPTIWEHQAETQQVVRIHTVHEIGKLSTGAQ